MKKFCALAAAAALFGCASAGTSFGSTAFWNVVGSRGGAFASPATPFASASSTDFQSLPAIDASSFEFNDESFHTVDSAWTGVTTFRTSLFAQDTANRFAGTLGTRTLGSLDADDLIITNNNPSNPSSTAFIAAQLSFDYAIASDPGTNPFDVIVGPGGGGIRYAASLDRGPGFGSPQLALFSGEDTELASSFSTGVAGSVGLLWEVPLDTPLSLSFEAEFFTSFGNGNNNQTVLEFGTTQGSISLDSFVFVDPSAIDSAGNVVADGATLASGFAVSTDFTLASRSLGVSGLNSFDAIPSPGAGVLLGCFAIVAGRRRR